MEFIIGGRGSGKTLELIKRASETHGLIVVSNTIRANEIDDMAHELGYKIPHPVSILLFNRKDATEYKSVFVDDVEDVLQSLLCYKVDVVTLSSENISITNIEGMVRSDDDDEQLSCKW
jgi:hypothetical protein